MLQILHIDPIPIVTLPSIRIRTGSNGIEEAPIPIFIGKVSGLPNSVYGLLVTSDLQAYESSSASVLSGVSVARAFCELQKELWCPNLNRLGVILAGDFFARPELDKRGGLGDVQSVWQAFYEEFRWVTGVAGNHDGFYGLSDLRRCSGTVCENVLDGKVMSFDGLRIGGISGVIGQGSRPWRRKILKWSKIADSLIPQSDVIVLHRGPSLTQEKRDGSTKIEAYLEKCGEAPLIICGHHHWSNPLAQTAYGQVLNVDYRVVLLISDVHTA